MHQEFALDSSKLQEALDAVNRELSGLKARTLVNHEFPDHAVDQSGLVHTLIDLPPLERDEELKSQLFRLEESARSLLCRVAECTSVLADIRDENRHKKHGHGPAQLAKDLPNSTQKLLTNEEYKRYGRQLIVPQIGLQGQLWLKSASVLIVGLGGLGSSASLYLAGAGVGHIGLFDGDTVDVTNLHRQIVHDSARIDTRKVDSARSRLMSLNPLPRYTAYPHHITPQNSIEIIEKYDVVLDCTDHPTSRYLISDTCVLLRKPLVSASALRTDGQLIVLNCPAAAAGVATGVHAIVVSSRNRPRPETVVSCGEGGILGPVVGVMGVLQALETIKLLASGRAKVGNVPAASPTPLPLAPAITIFSADKEASQFRHIRLRSRKSKCPSCSAEATITRESLLSGSMDYIAFCGTTNATDILESDERISAEELKHSMPHVARQWEKSRFETKGISLR